MYESIFLTKAPQKKKPQRLLFIKITRLQINEKFYTILFNYIFYHSF